MDGADFNYSNFTEADVEHSSCKKVCFDNVLFKRANLNNTVLEGASMKSCDLSAAKMHGVAARGLYMWSPVMNELQTDMPLTVFSSVGHTDGLMVYNAFTDEVSSDKFREPVSLDKFRRTVQKEGRDKILLSAIDMFSQHRAAIRKPDGR